jgi:amidophosphoribosyltransferase
MMNRGMAFWRGYNVELISKIFLEQPNPLAGFTALAEKIKGAYSLVILTRDGIYATRDIYGFRPLILGQGQGKYAVSSESRALHNLDMTVVRDVRPGEIVLVNSQGFYYVRQLIPAGPTAPLNGPIRPASIR